MIRSHVRKHRRRPTHLLERTAAIAASSAALLAFLTTPLPTRTSAAEPREWVTAPGVQPGPSASPGPQTVILRSNRIESSIVLQTDSPDVAVTTASNTTQSENSVFIDPLNPLRLVNSNNSSDWPVTQIYGADAWVSTDGGLTWSGSILGAGGANRGDPTTAISRTGRMFVNFIALDSGQGIAYSDNGGASWSTAQVAPGPSILDKNHLWVDNNAGSPHAGNLYAAWTNFQGGVNDGEIELRRSTNGGTGWSSSVNLSSAVAAGSHNQGVNVQTGPGGQVYVVWTIYDLWPSDETALGFAKSLDGGASWGPATRIVTGIRGHRNTTLGGGKTMRHNSFPSMTVNQQSGEIYIVWTNIGVPGTNSGDPDLYLVSSTNGGSSWSAPRRVNQDPQGNGKDQWFPWIACDPSTGLLACVFYDSRSFPANDMAETWVATSTDNGQTWQDFRVSDAAWSGDGIPGFSGNYAGDYIAIASRDNKVYPMWSDTRSGHALVYVSPFEVGQALPPVANFVGNPTSGFAPLAVQFTDQSSNSPTSWAWDFGDGGTSPLRDPSHTYTAAGTYTVSLTATNAYGSDSETKLDYISVQTQPLNNIHVQSIVVTRIAAGGRQWYARADVTIVDETNAPVNGATVTGIFNAPNNRTRSGTTGANGVASITSSKTRTPPADWCFTVTAVTKTGETYDPGQNVVTTGCEGGLPALTGEGGSPVDGTRPMASPSSDLGASVVGITRSHGSIRIDLRLSMPAHLSLQIFDVAGRRIGTLAEGRFAGGEHSLAWNAADAPSGVYFYRLEADGRVETARIVLIR